MSGIQRFWAIRFSLFLLVVALIVPGSMLAAGGSNALIGHWEGEIEVPGTPLGILRLSTSLECCGTKDTDLMKQTCVGPLSRLR